MWFSAVFAKDARHALCKKIRGENSPLTTSDHIVVETWLLLVYRNGDGRKRAFEVLR